MRPINEMWEEFAFHPSNETTRRRMEIWLRTHYPEAKWTVEMVGGPGSRITVAFESKEKETFYMLKWA